MTAQELIDVGIKVSSIITAAAILVDYLGYEEATRRDALMTAEYSAREETAPAELEVPRNLLSDRWRFALNRVAMVGSFMVVAMILLGAIVK